MIPHVAITDLAFLILIAALMKLNERNRRIFEWLFWLWCYVAVEFWFHVPMELAASWVMGHLG